MKILQLLKFWLWFAKQKEVIHLPIGNQPILSITQTDAVRRIRLRVHFNKPLGWNKQTAFEKEKEAKKALDNLSLCADEMSKISLIALPNKELIELHSLLRKLSESVQAELGVR
jgi:hypothetical protein